VDGTTPISLKVEADGIGSASFSWTEVLDLISDGVVRHIERSLTTPAQLLGWRFVDADGRDTRGPVPDGVVLVGFSTSPAAGSARAHEPEAAS